MFCLKEKASIYTNSANAILSWVAVSTRSRCETGWKRCYMFMVNQNKSPWVTRDNPAWGNDLIDFLIFGSEIIGDSVPTICAKVSSIRFWHIVVGFPDFALGGGRYRQVLKAPKRPRQVKRKLPVNHDMLYWLCRNFLEGDPLVISRCELVCAILMVFFFLPLKDK